tara:strand:+ start:1077 stop:1445 length:369 start_codon:yes stop_codon:yes gene_type:complete
MKYIFLAILVSGCGQSFNSNTGDQAFTATNGIDTSTAAGQRLDAAFTVLKNECMSCHTGYHNSWNSYKTDLAWQSAGLVTSGVPTSSQVYTRLKNVGGDMPQLNPQISETERQILEDWITQL